MTDERKYSWAEVESEVSKLGVAKPRAALLSAFRQGQLTAVVEFPSWRKGIATISPAMWKSLLLEDIRSGEDVTIPTLKFVKTEQKLLYAAGTSIANHNWDSIGNEYKSYLSNKLKRRHPESIEAWAKLNRLCFGLVERVAKYNKYDALDIWICATELEKLPKLFAAKGATKDTGGRTPYESWGPILEEVVVDLLKGISVLGPQEHHKYAKHVLQRVRTRLTKKSPPMRLPALETVARKLGELRGRADQEERKNPS